MSLVQDEVFHVTQTQRYCAGDWLTWDPKITTFPGTYVLGALYARILSIVVPLACNTATLRTLNIILSTAALSSALQILAILHPQCTPRKRILWVRLSLTILLQDDPEDVCETVPKMATSLRRCTCMHVMVINGVLCWYV